MTLALLEKELKPFQIPAEGQFFKWLLHHFSPQTIRTEKMHRAYLLAINSLMAARDEEDIPAQAKADLAKIIGMIALFIEEYEKDKFPIEGASPEAVLKFLMTEKNLTQKDIAGELGGQSVVSEILRGKRKLTVQHIRRLSRRFGVSPAVFLPAVSKFTK